jgi:hypothetical protein
LTIPVQAATQIQGGARDEQRALDEVVRAQIDLNHGHRKAAMHRAAKAETLLLNAQQAGTYNDPRSLAALEQAHSALLQGHAQDAAVALRAAESNLKTP